MIKTEVPPVQEKKVKKARTPAAKRSAGPEIGPTRQEIADRAYHLYLERGLTEGNPEADWLQAERELRDEKAGTPKPKRTTGRSRGGS